VDQGAAAGGTFLMPNPMAVAGNGFQTANPPQALFLSVGSAGTASPSGGSSGALMPGAPPPPPNPTLGASPAVLPTLFASTAEDPAREVVQVAKGAQGQNPMNQGFSDAGVRYLDGVIS
jgi:hypothetical protein